MKSSSFAPLAFAASLVAVVHAHKGTDVHDDQFLFRFVFVSASYLWRGWLI